MKVGRNDPCPCGSGVKYKKCCIDSSTELPRAEAVDEAAEESYPFLSVYNTTELLKTFAGLSVVPENHGKYFRIEQLITHALIQAHTSVPTPAQNDLKQFLDHHFKSHYMEDICVNTFTDLITFFGGDYLESVHKVSKKRGD